MNSRLGGDFKNTYVFLKKTEWFGEKQIEAYQLDQLRKLIGYCDENIPYYKRIFKEINLTAKSINSLEDLKRIPILTKEDVRNNYKDLINPNFKGKVLHSHTSGSTGKSLQFNFSQDAVRYRWALWFRHRARFGVEPSDRFATFTGQVVVPISQSSPPFWRENWAMKQTIFTMHHMSLEKVPSIVNRLNKGGFAYYAGYPSILFSIASSIEELGLKITQSPKVIFTGAEALLGYQREKISKVFGCLVTDQYGFSEGCGNASRCENDLFHEDFEYGVLECHNPILNDDGSRTGEVLATGFTNLAMPFIRYKVGDTATWIDSNCSCGRHSKTISKINGRNEDFVLTPEGNKILRFDYLFKDTVNIVEAQVVQKKLGEIIIRIVKRESYLESEENALRKIVHSKISPKLEVNFEYVNEIERENTGKFRAVKSYLNK
ncbi:coenzyme F390 synthetase [Flavobacterium frigoris PS1]|uniref:Coenzyme F390 synthetase n=2 Tax=Flavobacterium frigoris TaxID=229204 RepID=H7FMM3_FLAFP|nr:coenzyme F390 synthetase [Flavobacterium frigoris PS1]